MKTFTRVGENQFIMPMIISQLTNLCKHNFVLSFFKFNQNHWWIRLIKYQQHLTFWNAWKVQTVPPKHPKWMNSEFNDRQPCNLIKTYESFCTAANVLECLTYSSKGEKMVFLWMHWLNILKSVDWNVSFETKMNRFIWSFLMTG